MKYKLLLILILLFCTDPYTSFANEIFDINDIKIAQEHAEKTNTKLILVFTADWCKYCVYLHDEIEENIELVNTKYTVCYVDYDSNKNLVSRYKVGPIPTSIILDGDVYKKIVGFSNFNNYSRILDLK